MELVVDQNKWELNSNKGPARQQTKPKQMKSKDVFPSIVKPDIPLFDKTLQRIGCLEQTQQSTTKTQG
jgi:hypothetical protein